jgi:hypothetical protein
MDIADAQREMRYNFLGGFVGQLVSGVLWLISGALALWSTPAAAMGLLVIGGIFIFPMTQVGLRLMGRPGKVSEENGLNALGAQVAFVLPLGLPLVAAATLYEPDWFYPAFMVALGAHYLPFVFLYGMAMFAVLAGLLWILGILLATHLVLGFSAGAWITGVILLIFAVVGRARVLEEARGG